MDSLSGRIVVIRPGAVAAAAVVRGGEHDHGKDGAELIAGNDLLLFVKRGEGWYRGNGQTGVLRPNTLLAVPAGSFACSLSEDREMIVLAMREPSAALDDPRAFMPFLERRLSPADGRRWYAQLEEYADRATSGRFTHADTSAIKRAMEPYLWQRERHDAQATLHALFVSVWDRLAEPLTLERLAADVGYTPNYLNDLARTHTGRPIHRWITDMRMARARAALEHTDLPVADIGTACGYDDPAYFSRAFRRAHGVPPATWRIGTRPVDARYADVTIDIDLLHEMELRNALPQRAYSFAS